MTDELTPYEEDEVLAAEYVLGLLTRAEGRAFEERLSVDPGFRDLYARWAAHFTSLFENVAPVAPPARVLAAIQARLFPREARGFWRRLGLLPALAGAVLAAVVVLTLVNLDTLLPSGPQGPVYTAAIAAEDRSLVVRAAFDVATGTLTLERTAGDVAAGRCAGVVADRGGGARAGVAGAPLGRGGHDADACARDCRRPARRHARDQRRATGRLAHGGADRCGAGRRRGERGLSRKGCGVRYGPFRRRRVFANCRDMP